MAQLKTPKIHIYLNKEITQLCHDLGIDTSSNQAALQGITNYLKRPIPTQAQTQVSCRSDCPWVPDTQCPIRGMDFEDLSSEQVLKVCRICPSHIRYVKEIKEAPAEPHNKDIEAREDKFNAHYKPKIYPIGKCDICGTQNTLYPYKSHDGQPLQVCRSCQWKAQQVNA